jgi:HlyD family secretion protein
MKKWIIAFIVIIIIAVVVYFKFFHKSENYNIPTVAVKKGDITEKAQAVGYIRPVLSNIIKSQVDGTVAKIYHFEGDSVKKGDPLVEVKPAPSPSAYAAAVSELDVAKTMKRISLNDINRYKRALDRGLISENYGDYITSQKAYDRAELEQVLASQKLALLDVGNTMVAGKSIANIVTSPIDGYILKRNVDVGDPVISLSSAQSATALMSMADMSRMKFEGVVDEMDAAKIHLGMPAQITVGSLLKQKITGTLSSISLQSDKENQNQGFASQDADSPFNVGFKVEITKLKAPQDLSLRSGYSSTADVIIKSAKEVLTLPERVIYYKDDKPYVLLPTALGEKPKEQAVTIGLSDGMNAEIKSGVKLGQKVLDEPESLNENDNGNGPHGKKKR